MGSDYNLLPIDYAEAPSPFTPYKISEGSQQAFGRVIANTAEYIALVESRTFIRECILRSLQPALPFQVRAFSNADELQDNLKQIPKLILISDFDNSGGTSESAIKILCKNFAEIPLVVLAYISNASTAVAAISCGAKGYIPVTSNFQITIEAVRFVLAGGTYVPLDFLGVRSFVSDDLPHPTPASHITPRELAVVRAIQLGRSNKVIAYELGMSEGTVKVHVRRIMKKLNAKNRTEVAIKSGKLLPAQTP